MPQESSSFHAFAHHPAGEAGGFSHGRRNPAVFPLGPLDQIPVVVLSGVEPRFDPRTRSDLIAEWLIKPFAERELLRALRNAMGEGPDPEHVLRRSA